ncbi:hypothetical protein [Halomonas sp. KO116]|uniref:hypothetical protein n=1 Tax=Halomonas sp. KO116 TaxID=1504981 RepID=UPI000550AF38|nr:hypothetical protein [Halomonas sp. KO116]
MIILYLADSPRIKLDQRAATKRRCCVSFAALQPPEKQNPPNRQQFSLFDDFTIGSHHIEENHGVSEAILLTSPSS